MENPCASSQQSDRRLTAYGLRLTAAAAGFLLSLQTVWILRPGTLGGVPWPLATIGVFPVDVVLIISAVIGVRHLLRQKTEGHITYAAAHEICHLRLSGIGWMVATAAIASVAIVNIAVSADPALSAIGWLRLIAFLLALVGIPSWSTSARCVFLGGFLIAMLGHLIIGLIQFFTLEAQPSTLLGIAAHNAWTLGDSVITAPGERWLRAYGAFPHPNVLGTAALVALISLAHRPIRSFIIHHSSFIILAFALVLTFSRAALLGLIVLFIVLAARNETRRLTITGTLALVVALVVTASFWIPRITGSTPNEQRSLSERSHSLEAAIAFGSAPPFLGVGLHAMPRALVERASRGPANAGPVDPYTTQPTHNVPLLALAEIGPVGVFILVLVLFFVFRNSSFITHHSSLLLLPLAPSLLFDHHLWSLPIGLALVFVLAVAMSRVEELPPSTAA